METSLSNKPMKKLLLAIILLSGLCFFLFFRQPSKREESSKREEVEKVLDVIKKNHQLSGYSDNINAKLKICRLIKELETMDRLVRFAMISHAIAYPQTAGDQSYDNYFDDAFWFTVELISRDKSKDARDALDELQRRLKPDAGGRLSFDHFIERQASLSK
jgi:hypothetical protein